MAEIEIACLENLREKIKGDDSLTHFAGLLDDRFLLHFVRGRKYDVDRAFTTLQIYIQIRKENYRELFLHLIPSKIKLQAAKSFLPLKGRGKNQEFIAVIRVCWWPIDGINYDDVLSKFLLQLEEVWNHEDAERNGMTLIVDFSTFGLRHARLLGSYQQIQKSIAIFYKSLPLKYKQLHYLNTPIYLKMLHNFVKRFLPSKLVERIHFHDENCFDTLHNHVSPEILPLWLGGRLADDQAFDEEFNNSILKKDEYYLKFIEKLK